VVRLRWLIALASAVCLLTPVVVQTQEATYEGLTIDQWIGALNGDDWQQSVSAAWVLWEIGPPAAEAVPSLVKTLRTADEAVRMLSAQALGAIGQNTEAVTGALRQALNDPSEDVAETAAWALEELAATGDTGVVTTTPPATTPPEVPQGPVTAPPDTTVLPHEIICPIGEASEVVQSAVLGSYSLGLLDQQGNQLNPNVPAEAISLTPADLSTHAALAANGSCRTVADVVGFLAGSGVRMADTGQTLSVEGLLPDLQRYVTWSFAHQEDPRSNLGLVLASGPFMELPEQAPEMSGETVISATGSLLLLGDLLVGVAPDAAEGGWGSLWRGPFDRGMMLASLGNALPHMMVLGEGETAGAVAKIKGFITRLELDPNFINIVMGQHRWQWVRRMLALFECQNRLTVRLDQQVGGTTMSLRSIEAEWQDDAWWMKGVTDYAKVSSLPVTASVGFMSPGGDLIRMPFPKLQYVARLWAPNKGPFTRADYQMAKEFYDITGDFSEAKFRLAPLLMGRFSGIRGDGTESPLITWADAQISERGSGGGALPGTYRVEKTSADLPLNLTVSLPPGQTVPDTPTSQVAALQVRANVGALDFFEFWMRFVEPFRVLDMTPEEDDAFVKLATDKVLDITMATCPILFKCKAAGAADLQTVELLGRHFFSPGGRTPAWSVHTHLIAAGHESISGLCALQDNRETQQQTWLENLGSFSGKMTELNEFYQNQRDRPEARDALGRLVIGKFEGSGTWRGVKGAPGDEYKTVGGLTGAVRLRGTLFDGENGYEAEGEVDFYGADEWLRWAATEAEWVKGRKEAQDFDREYGGKSPFPGWEHPDWLEGEG